MSSPVNVSTKITIGFEDQFSAQACQAFETVKKCADDAFEVMGSFPKSLAPEGFQGDVALFSQAVEKFESSITRMNESLTQSQEEVIRLGDSIESPGKLLENFLESLKKMDPVAATSTILGISTALIAIGTLLAKHKNLALGIGIAALFI